MLAGLVALYVVPYVLLVSLNPPAANPDATAYLNLAEHYVDGDLAEAVVSHWAPLYTWLIAPLLAVGVQPITAASIIQGTFGVAALVMCWLLLGRLSVRGWIRFLTCLALVPLLIRYSYAPLGPDLLVASLYLALAFVLLDPRWSTYSVRMPLVAGLLVGVAYLSKGTAVLGLAVIASAAALLVRWRRNSEPLGTTARGLAVLVLTAGVLVAPWAVALSVDEDRFTLGTAADYSWAVIGPAREGAHPMVTDGFLPPPHAEAVSAWEDPARLDPGEWTPTDDPAYAVERFGENVGRYARRALTSVPLAALLALLTLFALRPDRRRPALALAGFALMIPLAYSAILAEERYAWAAYLLVVLLAGVGIAGLVSRGSLGGRAAALLLSAVVLSNAVLAGRQLEANELSTGEEENRVADTLRGVHASRVAASSEWHRSLGVTFRADDQFYGVPRPGEPADAIGRDLASMDVDAVLVWETESPPDYLRGWTRGPSESVNGKTVTVFSRN